MVRGYSVGISDLPTSSFVVPLLLLLMTHLPEMEASPKDESDDGKR